MLYYRLNLANGDSLHLESKTSLTDDQVFDELVFAKELTLADKEEVQGVETISEEDYEEAMF